MIINEPNEKAFPPNTQHLNLNFFTEKKESLKVKAIPHIHLGKAL